MLQSSPPFKYEEEHSNIGLTGLAGLPLYLKFLHSLKISDVMRANLDSDFDDKIVWKPSVVDLRILKSDAVFCTMFERICTVNMTGTQRRV